MNIVSRLRAKAIILYLFVALVVAGMLFFLYGVRNSTQGQKEEIIQQRKIYDLTNDFIYSVSTTQSSMLMYVNSEDKKYELTFQKKLNRVTQLIDSLTMLHSFNHNQLIEIVKLLDKQANIVYELKHEFIKTNPIQAINDKIDGFSTLQKKDTFRVSTLKKDTILSVQKKEGFFKRLGNLFRPSVDSIKVLSNITIDTVTISNSDSPILLNEVGDIARQAGSDYTDNILRIEKQVDKLSIANQTISNQITAMLLLLHRQTLDSTLDTIEQSEYLVARNHALLQWGGFIFLILMIVFISLIINDINHEGESRKELERANQMAHEVMDSRHNLLLAVSHDIKSPLNSIIGHLALAKDQGLDVHSMQNSSRHILALLENLLEFSSLEQGTLQTSNSTFSIIELGSEIQDMFTLLASSKGLNFTVECTQNNIITDNIKVKQIVINLVSNAIKYTVSGDVFLKISYLTGLLDIQVTDSGVGIPEDKMDELFHPFMRVEKNNKLAHGSGLGLYVTKGLIDLLQGTIIVQSTVNIGTTFHVTLPVEQGHNVMSTSQKRIAVYDDDVVVATITKNLLMQLGHKVVDSDYDIILTDMEMGEISGLDILHSAGNVPVIVMTGRGDFTFQKARKMGFTDYIPKPFSLNELKRVFGAVDNFTTIADDFLGDDREEIIDLFNKDTKKNILILKQSIENHDYILAQSTCHKMLPMYKLLGYSVDAMQRIDSNINEEYDGWEDDVIQITKIKI